MNLTPSTRMVQHALVQGSAQWLAHRMGSFNASDAAAMLGCSPNKTRSQLLSELHLGLSREHSQYVQERVLDDGHRTEALLRPHAEQIVGDDLYQIVGTREWPGIGRPIGASYDGLTIAREIGFECKRLNGDLRTTLPADRAGDNDQSNLPKHYRVQVEQQFMVCPTLEKVLFGAAEFDREGNPVDVRWVWCTPDMDLRGEIVAGWVQFEQDLAAYVPPAASTVEKVVAEPVESLPAVSVQVSGALVLHDNFDVFERALRHFLDARLIREPKSDQDFADLDAQIKAMKGAEDALDAAEAQMLAQVESVDQRKRRKDALKKLTRDNRLMAEKLLSSEKERRRGEIVAAGISALREHLTHLNTRLGGNFMPVIQADFGAAVKGKSKLSNMEEAIATTLANAKIAANSAADRIGINLAAIQKANQPALFPDLATLVLKDVQDCAAIIENRLVQARAAEERRIEDERARIRAEEEERARAQVQREQQEREAQERRQRQEQEEAQRLELQQKEAATRGEPQDRYLPASATAAPIASPAVIPMPAPAAAKAPAGPPTLRLGDINTRLAPLSITAEGLARLGFPVAGTDRAAKLYHEADWTRICAALLSHLHSVQHALSKEAA